MSSNLKKQTRKIKRYGPNYNKIFKGEPKEIIEYNKNMIKNKKYKRLYSWKYFYNELNGYYYYSDDIDFEKYVKTKEKTKFVGDFIILHNEIHDKTFIGYNLDDFINCSDPYYIDGNAIITNYYIYYIENDTGLCYIDSIGHPHGYDILRDYETNKEIIINEILNEYNDFYNCVIFKDVNNNLYMFINDEPIVCYKIDNVPLNAEQAYDIILTEIRNQE